MPSTQPSDLYHALGCKAQVSVNSPKRIWIINPFDQLPNESDVPLRYWALCRTFAEQGHEVIWWSSDFSHLTKSKRAACPDTDGFSVRLIETPPYSKNISFARLKNHKAFAQGFYHDAMAGLSSGALNAPDRIVVSLPPLGVAEAAFRIRDHLSKAESNTGSAGASRTASRSTDQPQSRETESFTRSSTLNSTTTSPCEVCVDIMDAWPETFYQALPKSLRTALGPILLAPLHRSAKRAYQGADKISAVGQSYLDLAASYLGHQPSVIYYALGCSHLLCPSDQSSQAKPDKPMHLCYHGTDLDRFQQSESEKWFQGAGRRQDRARSEPEQAESEKCEPEIGQPAHPTRNSQLVTLNSEGKPLSAVYLGAMGSGYDLMTIIDVAARWKAEGTFPFQIHFAGDGPQREALEARAAQLGLTSPQQTPHLGEEGCPKGGVVPDQPSTNNSQPFITPWGASLDHQSSQPKTDQSSVITAEGRSVINESARVVFHGQLGRAAVNELLLSADLALVPNRPGSLVACPYKAGEYAAAGLPMLSCLGGELGELLDQWDAGSGYNEGDVDSLDTAFKNVSDHLDLLKQQSLNARQMAEALFDRTTSYQDLSEFILDSSHKT